MMWNEEEPRQHRANIESFADQEGIHQCALCVALWVSHAVP